MQCDHFDMHAWWVIELTHAQYNEQMSKSSASASDLNQVKYILFASNIMSYAPVEPEMQEALLYAEHFYFQQATLDNFPVWIHRPRPYTNRYDAFVMLLCG